MAPQDEKAFLEAIVRFNDEIGRSSNDIVRNSIRDTWERTVCGAIPSMKVSNWTGKLTSIYDEQGPGANISVDISPDIELHTNSYKEYSTGIDKNSDIYRGISEMREGDAVVFSGELLNCAELFGH
jgi:hypothetical protein